MKRIITIVLLVVAVVVYFFSRRDMAVLASVDSNKPAVAAQNTQRPTIAPTSTAVPTSTIGYQETAAVAQATAMEAVRVNAQITAAFEIRVQEQLAMTAQADREYFEILSWTQQAAPTSIPLTATQQAVLNTQIPEQQRVALAQITATWGAPTQAVALAKAEQAAKFGKSNAIFGMAGMASVSLFCLALTIYLVRMMFRRADVENNEAQEERETVIQLKRDNGQGMGTTTRLVVPCTPTQLTELSILAVNGERTFAINRLETSSTLNRSVLYDFRNWAVGNGLATHPKPGVQEIVMNDEGVAFLEGWFENHQLPGEYKFEGEEEMETA